MNDTGREGVIEERLRRGRKRCFVSEAGGEGSEQDDGQHDPLAGEDGVYHDHQG